MNKKLTVKVVDLQGDYFQIGKMQGKEIKQTSILEQMKQLLKVNQTPNIRKAEQLLKEFSPNLLAEIKGLADELEVDMDTALLFSGYDVVLPKMGCTTLVTNGTYIRNYDFSPKLYDARLVFTNPTNGYRSVGFSQQIIGRLDGMNEKGLVVGLHFVNNEERAEGFISTTVVRMLLEQCADIEEATTLIKRIPHGYCYNYSITDRSGRSIKVEATPDKQIIIEAKPLVCTNHFESESLQINNGSKIQLQGSIDRQAYVNGLLEKNPATAEWYAHFNREDSPLFSHNYDEFFGTLHTVIYSPKDLEVTVGIGGNAKPTKYSIRD